MTHRFLSEIHMRQDFRRARHALVLSIGCFVVAGLSACSNVPYIAGAAKGITEQADLQTGSNLTRREKSSTGVREIDRDTLESSMRGTNANRDNGK